MTYAPVIHTLLQNALRFNEIICIGVRSLLAGNEGGFMDKQKHNSHLSTSTNPRPAVLYNNIDYFAASFKQVSRNAACKGNVPSN